MLASRASPSPAPGAASARRAQPRPVVLSDSDSEQAATAPARGAAPAVRPRRAAEGGDQGGQVAASPAKRPKTAPAAATPTRGAAPATASPAAGVAAGVAAPNGPRPAEEPWNVWIKDNPEFPPGEGAASLRCWRAGVSHHSNPCFMPGGRVEGSSTGAALAAVVWRGATACSGPWFVNSRCSHHFLRCVLCCRQWQIPILRQKGVRESGGCARA